MEDFIMSVKTWLSALFSFVFLQVPMVPAPILWTFENAAFPDGGLVSGSFVYDAATDLYSSVSVSVPAYTLQLFPSGSVHYEAVTYFYANTLNQAPNGSTATSLLPEIATRTGMPRLLLEVFDGGLTHGAGTRNINAVQVYCLDDACSGQGLDPRRGVYSGTVIGTTIPQAIPEPSPGAMIGGGVALLAVLRIVRRRIGQEALPTVR